jgi:hypothetical protein
LVVCSTRGDSWSSDLSIAVSCGSARNKVFNESTMFQTAL